MRRANLLRSSTFRLAAIYMALFAVSVLLLLGFIYWSTVAIMSEQVDTTIETEIVGLAEQYRQRGLNGLVRTINDRIERNPESLSIYLFASPAFEPLAGNLSAWPEGSPTEEGWLNFALRKSRNTAELRARARVFVLQGNFKLLVGRDVRELADTQQLIIRALLWGLAITVALALAGGMMLSRTTLRRLDEINLTSREIMAGDLSRRVPTKGTDDDFNQLAENLNAMLDEIERLMEGIRHVSDNIAHDLRTPLTRLRQRLEVLHIEESGIRQQQVADSIADADQLLRTFSALLRISRIEAGGHRLAMTDVDVATLVRDASEMYEVLAEDRGLKLHTTINRVPAIQGDRDLIFQAITNLLDNAVKYSPAGGQIQLIVNGTTESVEVSVTDAGPGIPIHERDKVTQRFYRLENSRSTPGSGLGLSLVAAIAAIHQAQLLLEGETGLKVTLRFSLISD